MSRFELETFSPSKTDHFNARLANVFVGCTTELRKLQDFLHHASNGSGSFIVISGEAGTGKSTLIQHFSGQAEQYGALTIEENFDQNSRFDPYAPFFRIIEVIQRKDSPKHRHLPLEILNALSIDDTVDSGENDKDINFASLYSLQTQYGLMQQRLSSTLLDVCRDKLVVVVLSDVHLAPQTSWQFIHYLSKNIVEQRILLLISLRQDGKELKQEKMPVYADVLQRMNRERLVEKLNLKRFTEKLIREYLNNAFQRSDFSSNLIPLLKEISNGIPGTLVKCLKAMYEEELIFEQNGIWFNKENLSFDNIYRLILDESQLRSVSEQLADLSDRQLSILRYASLMNGPFDYSILGEVLNIRGVQLARELMQLKEKKLLTDFGTKKFQFKRSELAKAILNQIEEDDKKSMHELIGLAIEKSQEINRTEKTYLLAYHFFYTEDKKKAIHYLQKAFDLALAKFAFTEAKDFFDQTWRLYESYPEFFNSSDIIYLLMKMVWLNRVLGKYHASIEHAEMALEACKRHGEQERKYQILIQKGLTYFRLNDWDNAEKCFSTCLRDKGADEPFVKAMANFGLGNVYLELAEYNDARQCYQKSLELAKALDARPLVATLFNNLGIIENILGNRMKSISLYSQSIPMFEKLGDNFGLARIYHNIGMTYADENSWVKANEFYSKSLRASDVMGLVPLKSVTFLNRALALIHLQKYEEAREYNFKAFRLLKKLNDDLGIAEYHKIQGILERTEKNWEIAEDHLEKAVKIFRKLKNRLGEAETKYEMGILFMDRGEHPAAFQWMNRAKSVYEKLGLSSKIEMIDKKMAEISALSSEKGQSLAQKEATA